MYGWVTLSMKQNHEINTIHIPQLPHSPTIYMYARESQLYSQLHSKQWSTKQSTLKMRQHKAESIQEIRY